MNEIRKKGGACNSIDKEILDGQVKELKEVETRLKNQLDSQNRQLESLPRAEIAQKRIALGKLSKDFERVKTIVVTMVGEANSIKVVKDGNGKQASSSSVFRMESSNSEGGSGGAGPQKLSQGKMTFTQQMAGQDVDDMIMEERERDIKKMNQDLLLVNEMFKDMAEIVEKQGGNIEKVAETTDVSHERAKAGLDQVKQAAESQQGCVIS